MPVVSLEKQGQIAMITIDNPPVNIYSKAVVEALSQTADEVKNDPDVKVVIVTGAGVRAFMAGGNIKEFPEWIGKGADYAKEKSRWLQAPLRKIETFSVPTIAAINGPALGGGLELALCCDILIAEEQVKLGLSEVTLGIIPGSGGMQRLPWLIGKAKAKEMIFTGKPLIAAEAKEIGMVNHVVPKGKSLEKALELAREICKFSFPILMYAKRAVEEGYEQTMDEGLVTEAEYFGKVFETKNVREGLQAFIEKRNPRFLDQ
ncbi:enoyl-CoA hydratase [Weizmannia acidilactici]|uniref:Enoyl-CoA hydratase n=1 Tax=Weizmannia acidilactici TaxID=2607726 RepID=A0A5J4J773_9BACI|nr:enoyl-CoA hydratase [Weizmannia acidilactici]GER70776.1 enoyl-CoA hydratase [Weizmannia acidilactici]GER74340.1 enoyl-CoA hydratase [Weizmannia acidilactici]